MGIRFAFDLGTNSIGWAVWRFGPGGYGANTPLALLGAGVRIFSDGRNPKDQQSLAVMRRGPRAQRRRRDRFLLRRANLIEALQNAGLWPSDAAAAHALAAMNPYKLRAEGLDRPLSPHEFGRALFHLNQRRGFQSNRKADRKNSKDDGKIAAATARLREKLASENARTIGEFLWRRQRSEKPTERAPARIRLIGEGARALYEFYPERDMVKDEFNLLWRAQRKYAPGLLSDDAQGSIFKVLFRQRPLKKQKVGKCTFMPTEERLPKALPSVEARVIYETLNHLEITRGLVARKLDKAERDALATTLLGGDNLPMSKIRKALKLSSDDKINFEEGGRDKLEGAKSAWALAKKGPFGKAWFGWPLARRDAFVQALLREDDADRLIDLLMSDFGVTRDQAVAAAAITPQEGYGRLGATANAAILAELTADVVTYDQAVARAGARLGLHWHHSDERDGEIFERLPYYPEILERHVLPGDGESEDIFDRLGRIPNPTVHICLNQLRRLANALLAEFGAPDEIVLELARDLKNSQEQKDRIQKENRKNREAAEQRSARLLEFGQPDTGENRARLRIFEEQERAGAGVARCPYTLRTIGLTNLFSSEIDVDHILPMSRTLDDGRANKILCYRECNRIKRNQTPYEAFGAGWTTPRGERIAWEDISANAATLDRRARWRFQPDAMERFEKDGRDFLARQLNETRYLSRLAKAYVGKICDPDKVWVVTGQMIGLLRGKWGLNDLLLGHNAEDSEAEAPKNRADHRHHAIDAIVIGAMTRGLVNEVARRAGQAEERDERLFAGLDQPFPEFRNVVRDALAAILVSHKPEHGKQAALHEDTAYGFVRDAAAAEIGNLVRRKPLESLTAADVERVRDPLLRAKLLALREPFADAKGKVKDAKAFQQALRAFAEKENVRRIRVGKEDASVVPIADRRTGEAYKAVVPGENHHMDIVQMRDGTWRGFAETMFAVNRKDWRPVWEKDKTGGKLVMRLHKGDMIEITDPDGVRRIKVVVQLWEKLLLLAEHNEGGALQKRHDDSMDFFRWDFASIGKLKERAARAMRIDEMGRMTPKRSNVA